MTPEDGSFDWGKFFTWQAESTAEHVEFMRKTVNTVMLKNLELEKEIAELRRGK